MVDNIQTPCIFCGSLRNPEDTVCPSCGEAWIDEHVTPPPPDQVDLHNLDEDLIDDASPDDTSDERGSLESPAEAALADADPDQDTLSMWAEDPESEEDDGDNEDDALEEEKQEDFDESDEETLETVTSSSVAADVTMTPVRSMYERKDSNLRLPLGLLAAAALAIIAWLSWFQGTETVPTTATVVAETTATQAPSTTAQPTSATSTPSSATTSSTTTSTATTTTLAPIAAIGSPLNLADLTMGGFAFGPFSFESDGDQVLGRLTATLGQPDALGPADTNWGLCETDVGTVVTWGGIAAIFRVQGDVSRFVGYRVGDTTGIDETDTGRSLKTLSGVALGDTVETLRFVYANSVVEVFDRDGQPYFRLLRSDTKRLLLYGPISLASDDGAILGIFAPDACS